MDQNMTIVRNLVDTGRDFLYLPKPIMENIQRKIGFPTPKNGIQVEVEDNDKSYWINVRPSNNDYYMGTGWKNIKNARGLKSGDVIQLDWKDTKFIFTML